MQQGHHLMGPPQTVLASFILGHIRRYRFIMTRTHVIFPLPILASQARPGRLVDPGVEGAAEVSGGTWTGVALEGLGLEAGGAG